MTTTTLINAQSVGTSTNHGADLFAQKLTPQSISDRFFIEALLTNGADGYDPANRIMIWYAPCSVSMTASLAPEILRKVARYLEIIPSRKPGQQVSRLSECEPLRAPYVYVWCDIPAVATAQTLTVNSIEGP